MKNPLLPLLLLLVAAIAVGDYFWPYGPLGDAPQWPTESIQRVGVVTQPARQSGRTVRMVLRLADDALVQLTAVGDSMPAVGTLVAFCAQVEAPRGAGNPGEVDYATYLRHQGIAGQAFCYSVNWRALGTAPSLTLRERMLRHRDRLTALYAQRLDDEVLAIVSAMSLGDRRLVDRSLRELYNRCGASHVLALSGMHLGILFSLLSLVLVQPFRRWGRAGRNVSGTLLLMLLWAFVFLAGLPSSLVRAATMFTIVTLLQLLRRDAPPFHSLLLALFLMLLWEPAQLFDVGLQLSAVAVAAIQGLTYVYRRLTSRTLALPAVRPTLVGRMGELVRRIAASPTFGARCLRAVATLLAVSFVAQLATLPLVSHYFGRISLAGFLSSLVVIPAAYVVLFSSVAFLLLPPLRGPIAALLTFVVTLLHSLMGWMATLSVSTLDVRLSWWGVTGAYALLFWGVRSMLRRPVRATVLHLRERRLVRRFYAVAVAVLVVVVTTVTEALVHELHRPPYEIAIYNRPSHSEIHLVTPSTDSIVQRDASAHYIGNVLTFAGHKVAIVDHPFAYVPEQSSTDSNGRPYGIGLPEALSVDAVLISHGAKGHLHDVLRRYTPGLVVLDGCLSDYYRQRFAEEAAAAGLPVYDVKESGALLLSQK